MLLFLMSMLALAGPVQDAQAALKAHGRGRDVAPLTEAVQSVRAAQARAEAPQDGPTWDLIASLHLAIAQDGPVPGRAAALTAGIEAAEQARARGGADSLTGTAAGLCMLMTDMLRRTREAEVRQALRAPATQLLQLSEGLADPPAATLRGQLAQVLAPLVLVDDAPAAAALADRAAALGHPSRSLDVRVAEGLVQNAPPEQALTFLQGALGRWSDLWELHDLAGGTAARLRQFPEAAAHFSQALEHLHPELTRQRAVMLRKRAAARTQTDDLEGAIADFEAAEVLSPADPTQRYQWGRAHVMAAQTLTQQLRSRTGLRSALPVQAQAHCRKAIPHLESVAGDARLGAPAAQALGLCQQVVAAQATDTAGG